MKKTLFTLIFFCVVFTQCAFAQITINSEPSGAKVYQEGTYIGTTPCSASVKQKLVYDIDANKVKDDSKPPYSFPFTITMEGYEPATVYFEGSYEYHEAGIGGKNKYYIVKPKSYKLFAVLKKDNNYISQESNNVSQGLDDENRVANTDNYGISNLTSVQYIIKEDKQEKPEVRWRFDSDPSGAQIYWRIKSTIPETVSNSDLFYLGTTPFYEIKPLNIKGLDDDNSDKITIEIMVAKKGFVTQTKKFSGKLLTDYQELNWYFELEEYQVNVTDDTSADANNSN